MAKQKTQHDPDLLGRLINDMVLAGRLLFDGRVSRGAKLIPLVMCVYILSPLDLVPEVFLPFGVLDDITVFLVGLQVFIQSVPQDVRDDYRGEKKKSKLKVAPGTVIEDDGQASGDQEQLPVVLDGQYEVKDD